MTVGQSKADEQLNFMQNCLLLGLEEKGIEIGSEIISKKEYSSVKETALFTIAEHFFLKGIQSTIKDSTVIYREDIKHINKSYTFHIKLLQEFPESKFKEISQKRIEFLEFNYQSRILFRDLSDYFQNERSIVKKKLSFTNIFLKRREPIPILFYSEGKDPNTYELINKYYDDIIINNPEYSIHAYYQKLLVELSRRYDIRIITSIVENKTLPILPKSFKNIDTDEIEKEVTNILDIMTENFPHHPLTIQSYLVAVSYFIYADIWDYDSIETKKWLELAVKNDKDKLGFYRLLTKEYLLRTNFNED